MKDRRENDQERRSDAVGYALDFQARTVAEVVGSDICSLGAGKRRWR